MSVPIYQTTCHHIVLSSSHSSGGLQLPYYILLSSVLFCCTDIIAHGFLSINVHHVKLYHQTFHEIGFEVLLVVAMHSTVLWDVTPHSVAGVHQCFGRVY
jgi:hypothetical protein